VLIGVDFDDVLAALIPAWLGAHYGAGGSRVTPAQVTDWHFSCLPDAERDAFFSVRTPQLYDAVLPLPGAQEGVASILAQGHRVVVVSSDTQPYAAAKQRWLDRYFPKHRLFLVLAKQKWAAVRFDVLIDDAPHNTPTILFSRPHNALCTAPPLARARLAGSAVCA